MNQNQIKDKENELIADFRNAIGESRVTISVKEAAKLTGISEPTLARKIMSRELKSLKPVHNARSRRVIHMRDLARFLVGNQDD